MEYYAHFLHLVPCINYINSAKTKAGDTFIKDSMVKNSRVTIDFSTS